MFPSNVVVQPLCLLLLISKGRSKLPRWQKSQFLKIRIPFKKSVIVCKFEENLDVIQNFLFLLLFHSNMFWYFSKFEEKKKKISKPSKFSSPSSFFQSLLFSVGNKVCREEENLDVIQNFLLLLLFSFKHFSTSLSLKRRKKRI